MASKSLPPRRTLKKTTSCESVPSKCASTLKPSLSASPHDSLHYPPLLSAGAAIATSSPGLHLNDANPKLEKSSTSASSRSNLDAEPQGEVLAMSSAKKIAVEDKAQESNRANSVSSVAGISSCSKADEEGGVVGSCGDEMRGDAGTGREGKGENEASEVDVAAMGADEVRKEGESRTRKVKKKVRIVKKIVKRRVPKRVVKGGVVNEEVGGVQNVGNWNERNEVTGCEKLDPLATASTDTETSKLDENVGLEVENENLKEMQLQPTKSIKTSPNIEKEIKPMDNVGNSSKNELGITEVEMIDLGETLSVQTETYKADASVASEVKSEDLKEVKVEAIDCIKTSPSFKSSVKGEDEEELCVSSGKHVSEVLVAGQNAGKESQGIQGELKNQDVKFVKMESGDLVADLNTGFVKQRQGEGKELVSELVENNDVGLNGGVASSLETEALGGECGEVVKEVVENNDVGLNGGVASSLETEALGGEGGEVVKEVVENNDVGLNGGVPLSEEMEALERKKRRRTEVFLGGLDKDTREEDIRKVFEQVGQVTEVRLVMNANTGKNKGFAFLRFASAADAKKALEKYSAIKICGKQCGVRPVAGNDTIYLGNINKMWKNEDVVKLLKDARIEKIDKVTVMTDPSNFEQNRGFAFIEFETSKDAQIALSKLQKHDVFINQMKMKVAWAQPLVEPKEEDMLKVKSIYAEYLPSSWDEEKVMGFFRRFGEIESISLAKNLPSSKRKDFAFVNYAVREAALACVQAFSRGQLDDEGTELRVKVSLAKPNLKGMQRKHVSGTTGKELNEKRKASESIIKVREPRKKGKPATSNLEGTRVNRTASATDELLLLLRQQALAGQRQRASAGLSNLNYQYALPGGEGPLSALGSRLLPSDPRGFPHRYMDTPHLSRSPSAVSHPVGLVSLPYSQQPRTRHILEPETSYGFEDNPHVVIEGGIYEVNLMVVCW
ncbi:uncharacterized protein [Coffea arabica]|uniref:Uncharacterized protein isoform X2 n=1 Tax=Coffea arabica TaxID=13443 RepID=A0ABM4UMR7_COFAR